MKKFLKIFIFFILVITLFLVTESYAFDKAYYEELASGCDGIGSEDFRVVVSKGELILYDQTHTIDEDDNNSRAKDINITDQINVGDRLEIFIYHEKYNMATTGYSYGPCDAPHGNFNITPSWASSWEIIHHKGDDDGYNSIEVAGYFIVSGTGTKSCTWKLDTSWKDIYVTLNFTVPDEQLEEPAEPPIVEPIFNYGDECDLAEDRIGNDELQMVVCQGEFIYRKGFLDNEIERENGIIDLSTVKLSRHNKIVIFLYAEQNNVDSTNANFTITCNGTGCYNTIGGTSLTYGDDGRNSLEGMQTLKFNTDGKHELSINFSGYNVNSKLKLILNIEDIMDASDLPKGIVDFGELNEAMEDELANGDLAIEFEQDGIPFPFKFEKEDLKEANNVINLDITGEGVFKRGKVIIFKLCYGRRYLDSCNTYFDGESGKKIWFVSGEKEIIVNEESINTSGRNSAVVQIFMNFANTGDYTFKITVDTDEEDLEINLKIRIGSNLQFNGSNLDYEAECEIAEDQLDNNGLKIIIGAIDESSGAPKKIERRYLDMKEDKTFAIYPGKTIDFSKTNSCSIMMYYEKEGLDSVGNSLNLRDDDSLKNSLRHIEIYENLSEFDGYWRNSYAGIITVNFVNAIDADTGEIIPIPDTVVVPVVMEIKLDDGTTYSFNPNVIIEFDAKGNAFDNVIENIGSYIPGVNVAGVNKLEGKVGTILKVITNIGIILAVVILMVIGVKYMLGSVEEKADYKKDLVPYLIGSCLVFSISVVVKILYSVGSSFNSIM